MRRLRGLFGVAAGVLAGATALAPTAMASAGVPSAQVLVGHDDAAGARRAVAAVGGTVERKVTMTGKTWLADSENTSISGVTKMIGAQDVWKGKDAKGQPLTGKGVGVAVIDSGIAPATGLGGTGKVVNGPDLSLESQASNLRNLDTFGHGTHMAGIIAGRDPDVAAGKESADPA